VAVCEEDNNSGRISDDADAACDSDESLLAEIKRQSIVEEQQASLNCDILA
jgi:hypothetical protein